MKLYKKQIKPVWVTRDGQGYRTRFIDVENPVTWYEESDRSQIENDICKHPKIVKGSVKYTIEDAEEALEIEKKHPYLVEKPYSDSALQFVDRYVFVEDRK